MKFEAETAAAEALTIEALSLQGKTWHDDVGRVCRAHGVRLADLQKPDRRWPLARIRWAVYFALWLRGWSLPRIGELMKHDHTTVMYGIARHLGMPASQFAHKGCASWPGYVRAKELCDRTYGNRQAG